MPDAQTIRLDHAVIEAAAAALPQVPVTYTVYEDDDAPPCIVFNDVYGVDHMTISLDLEVSPRWQLVSWVGKISTVHAEADTAEELCELMARGFHETTNRKGNYPNV